MKKTDFFRDFGKPVLVLTVIALIVGILLGAVNYVTEPIILSNRVKKAEEDRIKALPGAASFTEIDVSEIDAKVTGAFRENSGLGYVFTSVNRGYGGDVTVTVGLSKTGEIVKVLADVSTETTGVGSKAGEENYLSNFTGLSGEEIPVDTITNATYSSSAVKTGVKECLKAYSILEKGGAL